MISHKINNIKTLVIQNVDTSDSETTFKLGDSITVNFKDSKKFEEILNFSRILVGTLEDFDNDYIWVKVYQGCNKKFVYQLSLENDILYLR